MHTHYTSGVASMTYLKSVEAGADIIDTAMSPFALGTSQPATEVMVETFKGTPYDTGYDQNLLAEIADYFRPQRDAALESGLLNPKVMGVNIKTLLYQVPGGMLSNMISQLKEQNAEDRYYDVLREIPQVRKDLGLPNITEDWEAYVQAQKEHDFTRVYDYDIANSKLNLIISEQGVGGYDFVDGFIVKPSEEDEPGVLFDLEGDRIRDLPFSPKRLVRSDRYIFAQNYSNGHYMYYLYDPAEDKMLQTVELSNGSFYLLAAVGDSYYGISDNKYWYISAENFWNGKIDQMICMVSE